jgi:hypothetical protein
MCTVLLPPGVNQLQLNTTTTTTTTTTNNNNNNNNNTNNNNNNNLESLEQSQNSRQYLGKPRKVVSI